MIEKRDVFVKLPREALHLLVEPPDRQSEKADIVGPPEDGNHEIRQEVSRPDDIEKQCGDDNPGPFRGFGIAEHPPDLLEFIAGNTEQPHRVGPPGIEPGVSCTPCKRVTNTLWPEYSLQSSDIIY